MQGERARKAFEERKWESGKATTPQPAVRLPCARGGGLGALAAKPEGLFEQRFLHSLRSVEMTLLKSVIPSAAEGSRAHGAKGVAPPLACIVAALLFSLVIRLARVILKNRPKTGRFSLHKSVFHVSMRAIR